MATWSTKKCEEVFAAASAAGMEAAEKTKVPEIGIVETDVFGNPKPGGKSYTIPGLCGFAWVTIRPANIKFAKWLKANKGGFAAYGGGFQFPIHEFGQSVDLKAAYAGAFAGVLSDFGLSRVYADSRLD